MNDTVKPRTTSCSNYCFQCTTRSTAYILKWRSFWQLCCQKNILSNCLVQLRATWWLDS